MSERKASLAVSVSDLALISLAPILGPWPSTESTQLPVTP
jgi:hypothetical protein